MFCKTVGLLTVAVVAVAAVEATTPVCITVFVKSTLMRGPAVLVTLAAGAAGTTVVGLPPLCEVLLLAAVVVVGVCIGGLTSVTVGTVFTQG